MVNQTTENRQTGDPEDGAGIEADDTEPATHADIAALRAEIAHLGATVAEATKRLNLHRSEADVFKRIRQRFSYAIIVVAVLSFFGIQGNAFVLIDQSWGAAMHERVNEATRSVERANIAASQAKDAAATANDATDAARQKVDAITGRFDKIDSRIDDGIGKIESEIVGATGSVPALATERTDELQMQLAGVEGQVAMLSGKANVDPAKFDEQQKALRAAPEITQRKFAANANFSVAVMPVGTDFLADGYRVVAILIDKFGDRASLLRSSAQSTSADMQPPKGVLRSNTKFASIIFTGGTELKAIVDEIKATLELNLSGYVIQIIEAREVKLAFIMGICLRKSDQIWIALANWQPKIERM